MQIAAPVEEDRPFKDILEFTDVAGPVICREACKLFAGYLYIPVARQDFQQVTAEVGNVLSPLPQGGR